MTGLRVGAWTTLERARVRELFPRTPLPRLARLLGRRESAVLRCALRLFDGPPRSGEFGADDDALLDDALGVHDPRVIARLLRRSRVEVDARIAARRAEPLRDGPWTEAEDRLLRRRFGSRDAATLGLVLRRHPDDVEHRASELCLGQDKAIFAPPPGGRRMPRWRPDEIVRLREVYPNHDNVDVARLLGRSVQSVASKAAKLGLGKSPELLRSTARKNAEARQRR